MAPVHTKPSEFSFLALPYDIRHHFYETCFAHDAYISIRPSRRAKYHPTAMCTGTRVEINGLSRGYLGLLLVCRAIHDEAINLFYKVNVWHFNYLPHVNVLWFATWFKRIGWLNAGNVRIVDLGLFWRMTRWFDDEKNDRFTRDPVKDATTANPILQALGSFAPNIVVLRLCVQKEIFGPEMDLDPAIVPLLLRFKSLKRLVLNGDCGEDFRGKLEEAGLPVVYIPSVPPLTGLDNIPLLQRTEAEELLRTSMWINQRDGGF